MPSGLLRASGADPRPPLPVRPCCCTKAQVSRPVYLQLRDRIAAAILDGEHRDGDPLPSVRGLAADAGANPLTVARAYGWFQERELVEARRGVGLFVADGGTERLRALEREAFLQDEWPELRARLRRLRVDVGELAGE